MITLIGTGHVFNLSSALLDIFDEKQPDCICVELDSQRYNALMLKQTNPEAYKKASKNTPIIYKLLARFQDSMAKEYGVVAGEEMLTAIKYAQSHQLPIQLIDMNAQNLFKKMLREMSFSEKFKLILSGFGGFFVSKKRVEAEIDKIEGNFDRYIEQVGDKFPTIKRVLIDDRNKFMVNNMMKLGETYQNIISCIGDGHVPGISEILKSNDVEFETIRLQELRNYKPTSSDDGSISHFSFEYKSM